MLVKFSSKKDNFITAMIKQLKELIREEEGEQEERHRELLKNVAPVVVGKIKKLVGNRIRNVQNVIAENNNNINDI